VVLFLPEGKLGTFLDEYIDHKHILDLVCVDTLLAMTSERFSFSTYFDDPNFSKAIEYIMMHAMITADLLAQQRVGDTDKTETYMVEYLSTETRFRLGKLGFPRPNILYTENEQHRMTVLCLRAFATMLSDHFLTPEWLCTYLGSTTKPAEFLRKCADRLESSLHA